MCTSGGRIRVCCGVHLHAHVYRPRSAVAAVRDDGESRQRCLVFNDSFPFTCSGLTLPRGCFCPVFTSLCILRYAPAVARREVVRGLPPFEGMKIRLSPRLGVCAGAVTISGGWGCAGDGVSVRSSKGRRGEDTARIVYFCGGVGEGVPKVLSGYFYFPQSPRGLFLLLAKVASTPDPKVLL